jgi:uncharacterized membrane protein YedE/YeeE
MTEFTPISALIGGALIGLSATLLLLATGRIAGISGIMGGCLALAGADKSWRLWFLTGLVAAPLIGLLIGLPILQPMIPANWAIVVLAGALVGFGSRLGGGCTSGHGVCGVARLSPRSIVATATFMTVAILVVLIVRHGVGA